MARPDKAAAVAELSEQFSQSAGAVLTEYRGLSVAQLQELRRVLEGNATYAVVKNTLTKIAARDAGVDGLEDLLAGPSAIAFISGDPVEAAKGLRDFARNNQSLVIKGGVLDGKSVSPGEIAQMADLESREVLLAKMAGAMQASLQNAAYMFNAPLAQMARVLGALQGQVEADAPADAAPADAPAGDAPADAAPADAAPADAAPADAAPADAAPADAETADTASAEAAPADEAPDETAAPDAAPDDSTPTET